MLPGPTPVSQTHPCRRSGSGLKFSGFGTLGFWQSNGPDDLQFRRELGQNLDRVTKRHERSDSRLGLQLNYQATEHIELVGQVVARKRPIRAFSTRSNGRF